MANTNLHNAKVAKNDEFYTQYADIQKEVNAYLEYDENVFRGKTVLLPCDDPEWSNFTKFFAENFELFGLKKLISTSYAYNSKKAEFDYQPTLFETADPRFAIDTSKSRGKIFTLTQDDRKDGRTNFDALRWDYLSGDGDFRSEEVRKLRDEADFIITNPPFSLFREFFSWIMESGKKFAVIGNMNAINYREIFPYLKENKIWIGATGIVAKTYIKPDGGFQKMGNTCWFTNIDHGRRHQPLQLNTMAQNLKHSKHKEIKENGYIRYDNYNAIDVPYTDSIPADYDGIMGVPLSFLDKYCPGQFEIIWRSHDIDWVENGCSFFTYPSKERAEKFKKADKTWRVQIPYMVDKDDNEHMFYQRIFIKARRQG